MYLDKNGKYVFEKGENEPSSAGLSFGPIPSRVASSKKAKAVENWEDEDDILYYEDDEEDI